MARPARRPCAALNVSTPAISSQLSADGEATTSSEVITTLPGIRVRRRPGQSRRTASWSANNRIGRLRHESLLSVDVLQLQLNDLVAPKHHHYEIVEPQTCRWPSARKQPAFDRLFTGLIREPAGRRPHNELALLRRCMFPGRCARPSSGVSTTRDRRNDPRGAAQNGLAFHASAVAQAPKATHRLPGE